MDTHEEIARLQAQLRVIAGLLNETEHRLRDLNAWDPSPAAPPPPDPQFSPVLPPAPVTTLPGVPVGPAPTGPRFSPREFLTGPAGSPSSVRRSSYSASPFCSSSPASGGSSGRPDGRSPAHSPHSPCSRRVL